MNTALHAPQPAQILDGYVKMRFLPMLFAGDFMRAELNISSMPIAFSATMTAAYGSSRSCPAAAAL